MDKELVTQLKREAHRRRAEYDNEPSAFPIVVSLSIIAVAFTVMIFTKVIW